MAKDVFLLTGMVLKAGIMYHFFGTWYILLKIAENFGIVNMIHGMLILSVKK